MSSSTITSSPTLNQSYSTALTAPVTTTTDLFDIPTVDNIESGGSKPVQSYIYPAAAFVVVLVVGVFVCRCMERKRMRQRHAVALALRANSDAEEEDESARRSPPVLYTVYLDWKGPEESHCRDEGERLVADEWEAIMPISANLAPKPEEPGSGMSIDATPQPTSRQAGRSTKSIFKSVKRGVLVVLGALALHDRFAAEQRQLETERRRRVDAEAAINSKLPRELVTGIMIVMPSSLKHSDKQQKSESVLYEEPLPEVAFGVVERRGGPKGFDLFGKYVHTSY
ncbi:hypothetical protein FRB90_006795 [Tulasnella sp. 427]|nr:hypothetical protein FRB90_006795 [Tulasnella sp. 427]